MTIDEAASADRDLRELQRLSLYTTIERRLGVLPNFFRLASEDPQITINLWSFAQFAYLNNPLPSLFKERLFVYLSRFCEVRYCLLRHIGFLVGLGWPAGDRSAPVQSVEAVLALIGRPLPSDAALDPAVSRCLACSDSSRDLPRLDSELEHAILACASHVFLQTSDAPRCLAALGRALGQTRVQHLLAFLAFVRTAHYWTRVHPELTIEADLQELLATHEVLAQHIENDSEARLIGELGELCEANAAPCRLS